MKPSRWPRHGRQVVSLTGMHYLVVDDETRLTDLVVRYLTESGHTAEGHYDGPSGLAAARDAGVDAVLLDVLLPGMDGVEVCRTLRGEGIDVPVILLTARGAISERVAGLDAGADDYVVKPFAMEELLARLRAISRRRPEAARQLQVGDLVLDPDQQRAWRADVELDLARREFAVLRVLMENAGRVVSRLQLLDEVWDGETDLRSNAIDVHVSKVRAKVDRAFDRTTITTLRGRGYRLETAP